MATLTSIIGKAYAVYFMNEKPIPLRSAMPATVRFAEAPISVPLPPRQAPSDRHHHRGWMASGPPKAGAMFLISGIMVATKGMLSTIADNTAEAQRIA